jgi:hypothetical protein
MPDDNRNAFSPAVLAAARELDAPSTLPLSGSAGPWEVACIPDGWDADAAGWTVRSLDGGKVAAVGENFETVAKVAAVLPVESRPAAFDMFADGARGPEIRMTIAGGGGHITVARFAGFRPDIEEAMQAAHLIASCPRSLAWIMAAADTDTLTRVGELLIEILAQRAEDQRATRRRAARFSS